ncbi:MAG: T9SS type A sorting domain-containing protein [bacterium]
MLKSLVAGVLALATGAFALAPGELPVALTSLPPDVAAATTVQFWKTGDGQAVHTPELEDIAAMSRLVVPGTNLEQRVPSGRAGLDEVDEYTWPFHGHSIHQAWHNTVEPSDTLYTLWSQAGGGYAWAPWFGYPVAAEGYVAYVDCYNGYLYVRDIDDGTLVWSTSVQASYYYPTSPVIWQDGNDLRIAVVNYGSSGATREIKCWDLTNGTVIWNKILPTWSEALNLNLCRSIYNDGYIYVPMYNNGSPYTGGGVVRVNATTGDTLTVYRNQSKTGSTIGAVTVDATGTYGFLVLHNFSIASTWIVKFPLAGGAAVDSSPAQSNKLRGSVALNPVTNRLFIEGSASTAGTGYIYCYDATNLAGGPLWSTATSGGHDIQFTTIDDENVYVCTQSSPGRLYAVKQSDGTAAWGTSTYALTPLGGIYDGGVATTGEVGGTRYLYLTPGYYGSAYGQLWVVNSATGATVQSRSVSTSEYMFTGCARPNGYFLSKSGYGMIYCWESPNDIAVKNDDVGVAWITEPADAQLTPGSTITPTCWVKNFGIVDQTNFPISLVIMDAAGDTLYNGLDVVSVAAGESLEVSFDQYEIPDSLFIGRIFDFFTSLSGDQRPGNDHKVLRAMTLADTVYSYGGATAPAIDGYFAPGEWDDAYEFDCSNIFGWGGAIHGPGKAYAYFKHDNNYWYTAYRFPSAAMRDPGDQIGLYIDEDNDGAWATDNTEGNYWLWVNGSGVDEVLYRWHSPDTWGQPLIAPGSQSASGTLNGYMIFESRIPFGTLPYQLNINPANDEIGLWMYGLDGSNWYGWFRSGMSDEEWRTPSLYGKVIFGRPQEGDVAVVAIVEPRFTKQPGSEVTPAGTWSNLGTSPMTFTAWMILEDPTDARVYTQSQAYTLDVGTSATLTFPPYTVNVLGDWVVKCSTYAAGDLNPSNDVLTGTFRVSEAPPWPYGWTEVAPVPGPVKDGGWLSYNEANGLIYGCRGYKSLDFYSHDPMVEPNGQWTTLAPVPAGAKPLSKGANGVVGDGSVYLVKGYNTFEFYRYTIEGSSGWTQLPDVPLGTSGKKVKASDLVYVPGGDSLANYVYMLKGNKSDFMRFNTGTNSWEQLPDAPAGMKPKWDKGSFLVYDGENTIYAHKAKYHELFPFDLTTKTWGAVLPGMPRPSMSGKTKKAKDGSNAAFYNGAFHALKGGNTVEFWKYDVAANTWSEYELMPEIGSTGKKKRVKYGGDVASHDDGAFFCLKANKTLEFWRYVTAPPPMAGPARSGVMAGETPGQPFVKVGPNPLSGGMATVRYALPSAGPASINVFDVTGRTVLSRSLVASRSGAVSLDLRNLSAGIYLVKVEADGFTGTQKLVIQH